jgi:tripartite-type tricarboxylate transporter receptor subunit TctC
LVVIQNKIKYQWEEIMNWHRLLATALALTALSALPGHADEYPTKPVRIIVPFAPGAGNDLLGRLMAENLTPRLGQTVFVENRPGAGSLIGVDLVAKSPPDGHTILWAASDGLSILPAVKPNMPYAVPKDFSFISRIVELPFAVVVSNNLPVNSIPELIAYAKANPGKLRYGTSGVGGGPHMGSVLMEKATGIKMSHAPYKGVAPAVNDLLGGHIDLALVTPPTIRPHAEAGKVKVIATTGKTRHPLFPDAPTLIEAGLKDVSVVVWYGMLAPAGLPPAVLARLRKEAVDVLNDPKVSQRLSSLGYQISPLATDEFQTYVENDLRQWKDVAQSAQIVLED